MTGSIINPIWFYLMDVFEKVQFVSAVVVIIFLVIGVFLALYWMFTYDEIHIEEEYKPTVKKVIKTLAIIFGICIVFTLLIPSKDTMIEMMIAKYATYENAQGVVDAVKSATDYIVDSIAKLKG